MRTVSKRTENFIGCITAMHDLYGKVIDALCEMYGDEQAERIIEEEFCAEYCALKARVEKFMLTSIDENLSIEDMMEI